MVYAEKVLLILLRFIFILHSEKLVMRFAPHGVVIFTITHGVHCALLFCSR